MGLVGLASPQPKRRGEEGMCLGNLFPGLEASGPRRSLEPLFLEPLCGRVGSRHRAGWAKAAIAVQRGPRARPGDSEQAGSRQRAAGRQAGGGPGCSRGHGHGRSSPSQAAEGSTATPAPLCSAVRGYFFLGKKLNLFSLSFLLRLASGPVMEGRGRL